MRIGGLEAGGTKMVCAIGDELGNIEEKFVLPTKEPENTMPELLNFFRDKEIEAIGIGCFGPLDLNRCSSTYGYIKKSSKLAWVEYDMAGEVRRALKVPVGFDTDVNGAVLGEAVWGAAKGLENAIYITVGTGIGVGVYVNGKLLHGLVHPEGGHVLLQRHPKDTYRGWCPYHENCAEGLASGPAVEARWGKKGIELAGCEEVWELEAYYLAQAITDYIMTYSPEKIILGGGIMHQKQLYDMVRKNVAELLGGYISCDTILEHMDEYIVPPLLGEEPGIKGALYLGYLEAMDLQCSR